MKVTIITNYWKESDGGGIKTYLTNLYNELIKRDDIEVSVIFRQGNDYKNYRATGNKIIFSIKSFIKIIEIKPQIIHSHGAWYCILPGYIYKKICNVKLIHTFHSEPDKKLPFLGKILIQNLINKCDCVTFVSIGLQKKIEEIEELKFKNTAITYAGVKSREISEEEVNEFYDLYSIKKNSLILLVQAFTAYKLKAEGIKLTMEAIKNLRNRYPNIVLILTREGIYSNELKEYARKIGVYDMVIFTGDVDNPYIPLAICDVFLHPFLGGGGVSLVLLEAMSMGKPIIATEIGGIPEAIQNKKSGFLVKPDVNEIIEKIEYLLKNEEIGKRLGENAKKTAENKFTWENSANTFLKLYLNDK